MTPKEWLAVPGNSQSKLARAAGICRPSLSRMLSSKLPMSMRNAIRLDKATGGQIHAEQCAPKDAELIDYLRGPKQAVLLLKDAA